MPMVRLVNIFIADKQNQKFLAVKRSSKDKLFGGMWAFPGGKIEKRETPFEAAAREITEETGMKLTRLAKTPLMSSKLDDYQAEIDIYKGEIECGKLLPKDFDIQKVAWVHPCTFLASLKRYKYPDKEVKKMETFLEEFFSPKAKRKF